MHVRLSKFHQKPTTPVDLPIQGGSGGLIVLGEGVAARPVVGRFSSTARVCVCESVHPALLPAAGGQPAASQPALCTSLPRLPLIFPFPGAFPFYLGPIMHSYSTAVITLILFIDYAVRFQDSRTFYDKNSSRAQTSSFSS